MTTQDAVYLVESAINNLNIDLIPLRGVSIDELHLAWIRYPGGSMAWDASLDGCELGLGFEDTGIYVHLMISNGLVEHASVQES